MFIKMKLYMMRYMHTEPIGFLYIGGEIPAL